MSAIDIKKREAKAGLIYVQVQPTVERLYERWLDEKEYEDINDYAKPIKKALGMFTGVESIATKKRPFGFTYQLEGATYQVFINNSKYGYKRLK